MKEESCIFCGIARGDIPSATLYEDDDFRVILDISPASDGHALIIPKEHYDDIYGLDEVTASKALVLAKDIAAKLKSVMECDGLNILQNNGEAAGQSVSHFHIHLIPRYKGDKVNIGWKHGKLSDELKDRILKAFAK